MGAAKCCDWSCQDGNGLTPRFLLQVLLSWIALHSTLAIRRLRGESS